MQIPGPASFAGACIHYLRVTGATKTLFARSDLQRLRVVLCALTARRNCSCAVPSFPRYLQDSARIPVLRCRSYIDKSLEQVTYFRVVIHEHFSAYLRTSYRSTRDLYSRAVFSEEIAADSPIEKFWEVWSSVARLLSRLYLILKLLLKGLSHSLWFYITDWIGRGILQE